MKFKRYPQPKGTHVTFDDDNTWDACGYLSQCPAVTIGPWPVVDCGTYTIKPDNKMKVYEYQLVKLSDNDDYADLGEEGRILAKNTQHAREKVIAMHAAIYLEGGHEVIVREFC